MRSIVVLNLLSTKRVQSFKAAREEEIALFIDKVRESSLLSIPVNLTEMLATLSNDVICRVAFGRKCTELGDRDFKEVLEEFMTLLGSYNVGAFIPWLAWINVVNGFQFRVDRVAKWFDNFLEKVIDEHTNDRKRLREDKIKDFVDVLLDIQKGNYGNIGGFSLERDGIKGLIVDIIAGGTDTTYTVLEWAMTELLRHPEVMNKLKKEARQIGDGKSSINEDDLDKMHYLKAVIKETLRLHPPVPLLIPRVSTQDVQIKGYDIAARTIVFINAWAIGRDHATWDSPREFRPERFLNSRVDVKGHDFELLPFGAGRRGCPGLSFEWSLPGGATGENLDMTQCTGLVAHRKVPLKAVAIPFST